jgi:hypothetical protein
VGDRRVIGPHRISEHHCLGIWERREWPKAISKPRNRKRTPVPR